MPSKQKIKGSNFEREVATYLTNLYNQSFTRAPESGARIGGANIHRKNTLHEGQIRSFKGDIIPGQDFPNLNIECKSYADFPFHQLFFNKTKILDAWLEQLNSVADDKDFNILIIKVNRKGRYVVVESKHKSLVFDNCIQYKDWIFTEFDNFWLLNKDTVKLLSS